MKKTLMKVKKLFRYHGDNFGKWKAACLLLHKTSTQESTQCKKENQTLDADKENWIKKS